MHPTLSKLVLDQKASNPRADFRRLKDQLAERGFIGEWNSLMWPAEKLGAVAGVARSTL